MDMYAKYNFYSFYLLAVDSPQEGEYARERESCRMWWQRYGFEYIKRLISITIGSGLVMQIFDDENFSSDFVIAMFLPSMIEMCFSCCACSNELEEIISPRGFEGLSEYCEPVIKIEF